MESKLKAIIVDLDGTLCDLSHRVHFVEGLEDRKKDWDSFYKGIGDDEIHQWCHELIKLFREKGYRILFVTGRHEYCQEVTVSWLNKHDVNYDALYMRDNSDQRADYLVKRDIYLNEIFPSYDILFVVDDRQSVVNEWRRLGLVCLQCAEGNF